MAVPSSCGYSNFRLWGSKLQPVLDTSKAEELKQSTRFPGKLGLLNLKLSVLFRQGRGQGGPSVTPPLGNEIVIIKNNIIIIIRTFPECFAPEKFQCKIT